MSFTARVTNPRGLGVALQQARMARGLSQRDLAELVGASQRYIWELESGKDSVLLSRLLSVIAETGAELSLTIPEGDDG